MAEKAPAKPKVVCILTAGKGSRLNDRTKYFNKSLLRVGNKAVISYTIDEFDNDTEFVIALGYKGDIVKQYLLMAHPDKKFIFVWNEKYSEPGAGPGYALLQCKEHLQRPFFFVTCDAIIGWDQWMTDPECLENSWIAISEIAPKNITNYCTIEIKNKHPHLTVSKIRNKSPEGTSNAFTGVAYIHDHLELWEALESESKSVEGEVQSAPAMLNLNNIEVTMVDWWDTGSEEGLQKARKDFDGLDNLDKVDEELYILDGEYLPSSVVKYFHNSNIIRHRVQRVNYLAGQTPKLIDVSKNFYKYEFARGTDLFKLKNPQNVLRAVLDQAQENLWSHKKDLTEIESKIFKDICKKFYFDKTISRLERLRNKIEITDEIVPIQKLFNKINWDYLSDGIPARWHGDFNLSNILWDGEKAILLDWRQEFGSLIEYGDVVHDLAKMYHSFLFPHPSVKAGKFYTKKSKHGKMKTFIEVPYEIQLCKDIFEEFVEDNGYDLWKIKILTSIVLLNMSPLHESPIDEYLYHFAKNYLEETLNEI